MRLEIQCNVQLSADQRKILKQFNDKYDNWAYSSENELTFAECQHKLMHMLYFVLDTLRNSRGLIDMCKIEPPIKLRSYPNENDRTHYETMTLREMLMNCVHEPYEVFDMDDFEEAGASEEIIMERNKDIDHVKIQILEYEDSSYFFEDEDCDSDDDDESEDNEAIEQEALDIIMTTPISC